MLLPSGLEFLRAWLGLGRLGAVIVPINTALEGAFLAHQLVDCGARFVVADDDGARSVREALGPDAGLTSVDLSGWRSEPEWDGPLPRAADTACLM